MPMILVLEDDPELNQTITSVLKKEGYRVFSAYSCKEAKNFSETHTLDMAVLDINPSRWRRVPVLPMAEGQKPGPGTVPVCP